MNTCEVQKICIVYFKEYTVNMRKTLAGSLNDYGVRRTESGNPWRGWIFGWPKMMGPTTDFSVMLQRTCKSLLSTSMMRVQPTCNCSVILHTPVADCSIFFENPFSPIYRVEVEVIQELACINLCFKKIILKKIFPLHSSTSVNNLIKASDDQRLADIG